MTNSTEERLHQALQKPVALTTSLSRLGFGLLALGVGLFLFILAGMSFAYGSPWAGMADLLIGLLFFGVRSALWYERS